MLVPRDHGSGQLAMCRGRSGLHLPSPPCLFHMACSVMQGLGLLPSLFEQLALATVWPLPGMVVFQRFSLDDVLMLNCVVCVVDLACCSIK